MNVDFYNSLSTGIVSLGSVLNQSKELPLSKIFLIFPLVSHRLLLQHLSRKTTKIQSIEKLIIEKTSCFSNFNKRYFDSMVLTINSLQYLNDAEYIIFEDGIVRLIKPFEYHKKMGNRAGKIFKASNNISLVMKETPDKLYLNLRIEL